MKNIEVITDKSQGVVQARTLQKAVDIYMRQHKGETFVFAHDLKFPQIKTQFYGKEILQPHGSGH